MFSALTISTTKQGPIYNEETAGQAFAVIEKVADFAGAVLQAVKSVKLGGGRALGAARA